LSSLFIADLHLKISDSIEPYRDFIAFLKAAETKCDNLYILGDFFTYWYEHAGVDFYSKNPALRALKEFRDKGKNVYFIYGNRDFAAGEYFQKYSGVNFIGAELVISDYNKKIYLTHGDIFAKKDIRYFIWSRLIRSSLSSFIFKHLPVGYAIHLADRFKEVGSNRPNRNQIISDIMLKGAISYLKKEYDAVVAGHAHMKVSKTINENNHVKQIHILDEFKFPGEFLFLESGELSYKYIE
jgi:UDP-2,3-diacylglucosamine hydrolase